MTSKLGVELPHRWAGNENWKDIEVDNGEVSYNAIGRPLFRQCGFSNAFMPGWYTEEFGLCQCDGEAWYIVARTSTLTGRTYTDYVCLHHTKMWINPNAR